MLIRSDEQKMSIGLHCHLKGMVSRVLLSFGCRCALCGAVILPREGILPRVCQACCDKLILRTGGYCPGCGRLYASEDEDVYLCSACRHTPEPWSGLGFFAPYSGLLKSLVTDYKFRSGLGTGPVLGRLLVMGFQAHGLEIPDMVVPVPLHPRRLYARGYNQSLELARYIVSEIGGVLDHKALIRVHDTRAQVGLERKARLTNLKGAFAVRAGAVRGKHLLLVDDVLTTGTTLRTCARTLLRAGATQVDVLVLARA